MKMEEERECFQRRSWEGACVFVEAQARRESERATEAPLLLGPKWPFVAVTEPGSLPWPSPRPWPVRSVPPAPGREEQGLCAGPVVA